MVYMELDCRTALILRHPDGKQVLLLKRNASKKLLPNLITGIGGKVELEGGEGEDLEKCLLREFVVAKSGKVTGIIHLHDIIEATS